MCLSVQILHRLCANALIEDFESGLLSADVIEQEVLKRAQKRDVINLSKKFSIVTPHTSFVAIEERKEGELPEEGPSVEELVAKENIDKLPYVGWQVDVVEDKVEQCCL